MDKTRIFILYTGGTIGMAPKDPSNRSSPLVPQPIDKLMGFTGGVEEELNLKVGFASFDPPLDSSNVNHTHWIQMAEIIAKNYDDYDGFVILHGTDTMAYTASGLAFILNHLAKPVVITGSQLPISAPRTDAVMNLVNAIHIAGYKATNLPCIPEVVVVFADKILRGCRTRKISSSSWAGFTSPNFPPLGAIGEHIRINTSLLNPLPSEGQPFHIATDLVTDVMDIAIFPGFRANQLEKVLNMEDVRAVILRTFGAGNAPDHDDFLQVIHDATTQHGKIIVNITQCFEGMVEMGLYATSLGLLERGVISGLDMTPEAALAKLFWTLGYQIGDQVQSQMQVSQRGEQSENLFDLRYGGHGKMSEPKTAFDAYKPVDRRFSVAQFSRAVVRFSKLGLKGVAKGKNTTIKIFMNMPAAKSDTPADHPRCIAEFQVNWLGEVQNLIQVVDERKAKGTIGDGDITLSVRTPEGVSFWFEGLFLALFAKA